MKKFRSIIAAKYAMYCYLRTNRMFFCPCPKVVTFDEKTGVTTISARIYTPGAFSGADMICTIDPKNGCDALSINESVLVNYDKETDPYFG